MSLSTSFEVIRFLLTWLSTLAISPIEAQADGAWYGVGRTDGQDPNNHVSYSRRNQSELMATVALSDWFL
jgi:hypothetical protein